MALNWNVLHVLYLVSGVTFLVRCDNYICLCINRRNAERGCSLTGYRQWSHLPVDGPCSPSSRTRQSLSLMYCLHSVISVQLSGWWKAVTHCPLLSDRKMSALDNRFITWSFLCKYILHYDWSSALVLWLSWSKWMQISTSKSVRMWIWMLLYRCINIFFYFVSRQVMHCFIYVS